MSATSEGTSARAGDPSAARNALTRVLALESRNALSRVELAASGLARFDASPAMQEMLETIREAVGDLDGLLGKLGDLWSPRSLREPRAVDPDVLVERVLERLAPTLRARGIEVRRRLDVGGCRLPIGPIVLERLLFGFLRLGLGCLDSGDSFELETRRESGGIELIARETSGRGIESDRLDESDRRLELELSLAECGGSLSVSEDGSGLRFWIPEEGTEPGLERSEGEE
ncbi:MAG TPA: hypothetical protein VKA74_19135 [Myxococcota bacterium]|nr:hypothetical protein [Myxococcota bacterium]